MQLHVICGYPSKSQGTYDDFDRADFDAYKLVRAVKGTPFNGYCILKQSGTDYRIENNQAGRTTAMRMATRALAATINVRMGLNNALIVPVPASNHVVYGETFTGSRLADGIANAHEGFVSSPAVVFDQVMQKASEGGPRDPAELAPHMRIAANLPNTPIVIVDDVTSTHGHLKALARRLHSAGHNVVGACAVAQTVWSRPPKMFAIDPVDLIIDSWPGNDPCLF